MLLRGTLIEDACRVTPTQALLCALQCEAGGVTIVWYPEPDDLIPTIQEIEGLAAPGEVPFRTGSIEEVIAAPGRLVLLVPENERACVEELEGRLGQLLDPPRLCPVVLFLLRGGRGQDQLARSPELSGWTRGRSPDPGTLAQVDVARERARFAAETGRSVEDWLTAWRAGQILQDGLSFGRAYLAALLGES